MPYADPVKRKEYHKQYRAVNREKAMCYAKQYKLTNSESIKAKAIIRHKLYPYIRVYTTARGRCSNKNNADYKYYGGKGVKFRLTLSELERIWFRDKAYLLDKPSIDRKDSTGDYCYKNCRFIEHSENCRRSQIERWGKR